MATLRGPVGLNRVYASVANGALSSESWLEALRQGRTFATNGPLLDFSVAGNPIGSTLRLRTRAERVFSARLRSIVPVTTPRLSATGRIARELALGTHRDRLEVSGTLPIGSSGWCLLRAFTARAQYPVLDNFVYATTSPVYVSVRGESRAHPTTRAISRRGSITLLQTTGSYPTGTR